MPPASRPSPKAVLAIASLGSAVAFIDATIVNIAFPDIARSFPGTPIATLSWILNAYNIVFAAFLMAAAGLADLLGRRRVFVFGLELFTAGSLLCALSLLKIGTVSVANAVMVVGAAGYYGYTLANVLIRPQVQGVGLLEFASLEEAREAGRRAARMALEQAPASLVA
jgi:MFS family permease